MLTVHHLGVSQSERIVWLCEELDLDYELKRYERRADNRLAPDAYKALHPMGVAPVITDGALVLARAARSATTSASAMATAGSRPRLPIRISPSTSSGFTGPMGPMDRKSCRPRLGTCGQRAADVPFVKDRLERCRAMIERRLGEAPFFGGRNLSHADIMMVWSLTTARTFRGGRLDGLPNTLSYLERIGQRPAYRRAMAKAEPGMAPMLA